MSKSFITICNDCKFLSGPQRGIDKWVSCKCGHASFFSSRDITSGKWTRFDHSVVPDEWRVTTDQTIVFILRKKLVNEIKSSDMEWSDNEEEEDGELSNNVEDFSYERIMYIMDNGEDSEISESDSLTSSSDSDTDSDSDSDTFTSDTDSDSDSDTFTSDTDSDSEGFGEWEDEIGAFERENPFEYETDTDYSADTDSEDEEERRMRDYFNTIKRPTN